MNGFFLGGVAEGMESADKRALARSTLENEVALRKQQLGISERAQALSEKNAARSAANDDVTRATTQISDLMTTAAETAKQGLAAGRDPATIGKAIAPLVEQAKRLAPYAKMDPTALEARGAALLTAPTQTEATSAATNAAAAKAEGEAVGAARGQVRAATELQKAGVTPSPFKDPKDKVAAEDSLRDDFLKQSTSFITLRDAKNRLDTLETTGAGDMALVFQYMKMLDPTSTVREGEYATASNSGGVPSAIQGLYNKALGEGSIGTKARAEILTQANKFYQAAGLQHDRLQNEFTKIAKSRGMNVDNVVINLAPNGVTPDFATPAAVEAAVKAGKVKVGDVIRVDGRLMKVNP